MGLFGPSQEEKLAYEEAKEVFKKLVEELHLSEKVAYMPKIEVKQMPDKVGEYDPDRHVLKINRDIIKQYLESQKSLYELEKEKKDRVETLRKIYGGRIEELKEKTMELEEKMNVAEEAKKEFYKKMIENTKEYLNKLEAMMKNAVEDVEKRYERLKEERERGIESVKKYLRGVAVHEFFHSLRYRMHPETKKYERIDPARRETEDALANMAEAIILDMDEREIIQRIRSYESSLIGTLYESMGSLITAQAELYEGLIGLGEKEKEKIERQKMTGKAITGFLRGYRLGLAAALGIKDKPREERISILEELLKNDKPEEILKRLREMAGYSFKKHPELRESIMTEEETHEQTMKEVEEAKKKRSVNFVLVSLITFIVFLSLLLPSLSRSEKTTGSFLFWSSSTYLSFFLLFFSVLILLSIFLVKNTNSKETKVWLSKFP